MVYNLRNRENLKRVYDQSSYSESDSDSSYPQRRPQTRLRQRIISSLNSKEETAAGLQTEVADNIASTSRSPAIVGGKRGRPQNKRDNREGDKQIDLVVPRKPRGTKKRKASFSIYRTPRSKNANATPSQIHRTVLSWLIDSEIVKENAKVWYMDHVNDRVLLEGAVTRAGISCCCCNKVITVQKFEEHAGSDAKRPYENIVIAETRMSLLTCQISAWNWQAAPERNGFHQIEPTEGVADHHDDACVVCSDGGDLICCEQCPSTFHHTCMYMQEVPQGAWHCPYCVCKFCGFYGGAEDELFKCFQCEKKYHRECSQIREKRMIDLNRPSTTSFCGESCREIFEKLEKLIGVRNELEDGFSWTLLRRINPDSGVFINDLHKRTEYNSKIAIAWDVMNESFTISKDRQTKINVIRSVVYNCGSNYARINFGGFYTAVLEKGDEIISVATLRVHGTRLAEMPLVATRWSYRKRGMFHKLMIAIESALCFLKVENLVIPSIQSRINNWIESYGFNYLDDAMKKEIPYFNTLMFHCAVRLQKTLLRHATDTAEIAARAMEVDETKNNNHQNGLGSENNSTKPALISGNGVQILGSSSAEMEVVDGLKNNDNRNVLDSEDKSMRQLLLDLNVEYTGALLDLNLEPPVDDEMNTN